ncbi:hypothetical protein [Streptomyces apocyni]|uniref:hypothetical protein n=1 Tax=Streptomyces apocyni TaxID=2654677 RepID=UPI0012EABA0D|nr:hypothetical protein [Streptomyces apocyni]
MIHRTGRLRAAAALTLVLGGALLVGACSSGDDAPSGAKSPRAAAVAYVKAVNEKDEKALRDLYAPQHSKDSRTKKAKRLVGSLGDDVQLKVVDVKQDVSPKFASVRLGGSTSGDPYAEYIQLSEGDGAWWVVPDNAGEGLRHRRPYLGHEQAVLLT